MTRVEDVRPCPNCASKVLPVSICNTCGEVAVRSDLSEVDRRLPCRECRTENLTLFVCNKCGNRYLFEEVVGPSPERFACPLCGTFIEPMSTSCPACGTVFTEEAAPRPKKKPARTVRRVRREYSDLDLADISRIPGVGRAKAEVLCRAGYNSLWKIKRAPDEELARVPDIGPRGARTIRNSLRFILLLPRRTKESILEEECVCPLCGCITSLFARDCMECGVGFDEEEIDDELGQEVEGEEDRGLLAFYDVRLEESPNDAELWYARALLLLDMAEYREAMRSIDVSIQLGPVSRRAALTRSRILAAIGMDDDAARALRTVLAILVREGESLATAREEEREVSAALESLAALGERECSMCGETVLPGAQKCPVCGQKLVTAPPPLEPPSLPSPPEVGALGELEKVLEAISPPADKPEPLAAEKPSVPAEEPKPKEVPPKRKPRPKPEPAKAPEPVPRPPEPAPPEVPRIGLRSPELATRHGLINGGGRVNGLINGKGLINGGGRVNGLINGTGFINGSALTFARLPRQRFAARYVVIAGSLLMAFIVAASLLPQAPPPSGLIVVDGDPADWAGIPRYADTVPASDPNVALTGYGVTLDAGRLFLLVQVSGQALGDPVGYDAFYVFLDADGSTATGYSVGGLGADYVAEVFGGSGRVVSARLFEFPPDAELNWSRRSPADSVLAQVSGSTLELSLYTDVLSTFSETATTILVAADDFDGSSARASVAITATHGAVRVRQVPLVTVVPPGTTDVLRLEIAAVGEVPAGASWAEGPFTFTATTGLTVVPSASQVTLTRTAPTAIVTVSVSAIGFAPGAPLKVALLSAGTSRPLTVVGEGLDAYFESIPPGIRIDGLFADWSSRTVADSDAAPVLRPSLDATGYGGAANASGTFFMLQVAGPLCEGGLVPQRLVRPSGGGGGGGGPVSAPPPRVTGEDVARVYIDANATDTASVFIGGLYADYMVEVRGTHGRIVRQIAYRWQSGWLPAPALSLQVAKNATALEGSIGLSPAILNGTRMVFETSDWSGQGDVTTVLVTRSGTPGTRGELLPLPLHGGNAQTAYANSLGGAPTVDGDCTDTAYADAGVFASSGISGKVGTYGTLVYICIEATLDDTDDGAGDYARIYFDRDHDGGLGPTGGDRRFTVTSGSSAIESMRGNSARSAWEACDTSSSPSAIQCHADDQAEGAFSTHEFYEFQVHYLDVWNATSPSPGFPAGFAVIVMNGDDGNPATYTWGSTSPPDDLSPDTWGHLDIPEFPSILLPVAVILVVLGVLRRRRRQIT